MGNARAGKWQPCVCEGLAQVGAGHAQARKTVNCRPRRSASHCKRTRPRKRTHGQSPCLRTSSRHWQIALWLGPAVSPVALSLHLSIVGAFEDDLGPQVFKFKHVYHLLFAGLELTLVNWFLKSAEIRVSCRTLRSSHFQTRRLDRFNTNRTEPTEKIQTGVSIHKKKTQTGVDRGYWCV